MPRTPPPWKGRTDDSKPPASVRVRVFDRHGGICHISGRKIRAGEAWELEHVIPLSMGGANEEANLAPALVDPHKEKTAEEAGTRAKADRVRKKHLGLKQPSRSFRKPAGLKYDWKTGRYEWIEPMDHHND